MKIVHLINNTYQVVSNDKQTIFFQGSKEECDKYVYPCILENGCDGLMCYDCIKKHELNKPFTDRLMEEMNKQQNERIMKLIKSE